MDLAHAFRFREMNGQRRILPRLDHAHDFERRHAIALDAINRPRARCKRATAA
jgi:hypothetical protein